jgi:hypothetical protein
MDKTLSQEMAREFDVNALEQMLEHAENTIFLLGKYNLPGVAPWIRLRDALKEMIGLTQD